MARVRTYLTGAVGALVNVSYNASFRLISHASMNPPIIAMRGSRPLYSRVDG